MDLEARVGEAVRRLRTARGWSQEQLAKHLSGAGLQATQSTVARIEGARRPLRLNEAATLAKVLDVDLATLYSRRGQRVTTEELPAMLDELWQVEAEVRDLDIEVEVARSLLYRAEVRATTAVSDSTLVHKTRDELRTMIASLPNGEEILAQHDERWAEHEYQRNRSERDKLEGWTPTALSDE